jgi:sec-independent protein translocase protein TatA
MRFGGLELIIILAIVLIIFGAGKLPQVGEALGRGLKSLRGKGDEETKNDSGGVQVIRRLEDDKATGQVNR